MHSCCHASFFCLGCFLQFKYTRTNRLNSMGLWNSPCPLISRLVLLICFQVVVIGKKIISFFGHFILVLELLMLVWIWMVDRVQKVGGWNERQRSRGCSRVRIWISSAFLDCFHPPFAARARICSCSVSPAVSGTQGTSFWIRVVSQLS